MTPSPTPARIPGRSHVFSIMIIIVSMGLTAREISQLAVSFAFTVIDVPAAPLSAAELAARHAASFVAAIYAVVTAQMGTALYACGVYAVVVFAAPRVRPRWAALAATVTCWLIEMFQLTGVPAQLAWRDPIAALLLGTRFDWLDMAAYPAGAAAMFALHRVLTRAASPTGELKPLT